MANSSYHETQSAFYTFTVAATLLSSLLSFIACLLNYFYSINKRSNYHTLVTLLILCDGFGSLCFAIWAGIDEISHHHKTSYLCQIFLPFPTYFFLLSFCWTSLIALRFQKICQVNNAIAVKHNLLELPLWPVPLLCFLLILPIILLNISGINVSETISAVSTKGLDFCFFASTNTAFIANLLTFQLPCIVTVIYNIRCFRLGIQSLRSSPERVMEREVRRARSYLLVLLVIWVPNLAVNLYHFIFLPADKDPYFPVQALVLLTTLQGFINFFVYMWGYKPFQQWLSTFQFYHLLQTTDDFSDRGSSLANGFLLIDSDDGVNNTDDGDDNDDDDDQNKAPLTKSILATSPNRDSSMGGGSSGGSGGGNGGSRTRIASGEKAVRFEERHECRYYDVEDHTASSSEVNAFMPRTGYYTDESVGGAGSPSANSHMSLYSNI